MPGWDKPGAPCSACRPQFPTSAASGTFYGSGSFSKLLVHVRESAGKCPMTNVQVSKGREYAGADVSLGPVWDLTFEI
jgi:hypothetical protein